MKNFNKHTEILEKVTIYHKKVSIPKLSYNGQCKSAILIKQGKFTPIGNVTNTMNI